MRNNRYIIIVVMIVSYWGKDSRVRTTKHSQYLILHLIGLIPLLNVDIATASATSIESIANHSLTCFKSNDKLIGVLEI